MIVKKTWQSIGEVTSVYNPLKNHTYTATSECQAVRSVAQCCSRRFLCEDLGTATVEKINQEHIRPKAHKFVPGFDLVYDYGLPYRNSKCCPFANLNFVLASSTYQSTPARANKAKKLTRDSAEKIREFTCLHRYGRFLGTQILKSSKFSKSEYFLF